MDGDVRDWTDRIEETIKNKRNKAIDRQEWINLFEKIIVFFLTVCFVCNFIVLFYRNLGNEMFPAIKDGDLLICNRLSTDYSKDDVVVYKIGNETKTGRIVALSGDIVEIGTSGNLIVNGAIRAGEIVYATYAADSEIEYPYTVPDGYVFILGDYRTVAEDSRTFGAVSEKDIKGIVISILRRREF